MFSAKKRVDTRFFVALKHGFFVGKPKMIFGCFLRLEGVELIINRFLGLSQLISTKN